MKIAFGLGCTLAMIGTRAVLDVWAGTAGPFALVYPTVVIATLYGHWQAGLVSYSASFLWAWYFILPAPRSFHFELASDPPRVLINAVSALVVLLLAESFRRAVTAAMVERDLEIERRAVLLQELEHRTKNNFALAASLLELQKRREAHPQVTAALEQALARIRSFAAAYANLAQSQGEGEHVAMHSYLEEVVEGVRRGAFPDNVELRLQSVRCTLPREVAVAIGLFTNEALTNCAKYAFPDGRSGKVDVLFEGDCDQWVLTVADDGVGNSDNGQAGGSGGIGNRLLAAFAQQAEADYEVESGESGRVLRLAKQA